MKKWPYEQKAERNSLCLLGAQAGKQNGGFLNSFPSQKSSLLREVAEYKLNTQDRWLLSAAVRMEGVVGVVGGREVGILDISNLNSPESDRTIWIE